MLKITRSMSIEYGGVAQDIYVSLCGKFKWDICQKGNFAKQKRLYAKNATQEGSSVWFLANSNWTKTKSGCWKNKILDDTVIETWEKQEDGLFGDKTDRVIFAKNRGQYVFLGVYEVVGVEENKDRDGKRIWKKTYKKISDTYPI